MFAYLCVSLLFSAAFAQNTLQLGGGVEVSLDKDSPVCDIEVVVPTERALGGCKILINTYYPASSTRPTLAYYWNRGAASADAAAKLAPIDGTDGEQAWASCSTAGTYHLGVEIEECTACIAGANGGAVVTATWQFDNEFHVDLVDKMRSAWLTIGEGEQVVYALTAATTGTAHFDVDKSTASQADDLEYMWRKAGGNWTVIDSSNLLNNVEVTVAEAGDYELAIKLIDAPAPKTTTEFQVDYQFNAAPDLSWPEAVCPQEDCAPLASCTLCAENDCAWCSTTKTCGASCPADETTTITDDAKCPDVNAECATNEDCVSCADAPGCVWCDTGGALASALSTGTCNAGVDDLGKECSGIASTVTDAMQCDSASVNSAIAALALVLAVACF